MIVAMTQQRLTYLNRIDPHITVEQGERILNSLKNDLAKLRPKARKATEDKIKLVEQDLAILRQS